MSTKEDPFVHLHTHTDYSLLDGASAIPDVVDKVAKDGAPALAVTDHGSMGGIVELVRAAKAAGITPIPGIEAYHSTDLRRHSPEPEAAKSYFHLTLLGVNKTGYHNLLKVSSTAHMEGTFYHPRLDDDLLSQHSEGIVTLSGCLGSRFNQALLREDFDLAKQVLSNHKDIFGDRFFIEVMDHDIADQKIVAPYHVKFSKELGIPMVATNDSHYTHEAEGHMHDALLCAGTKAKLSDADRFRFHGHGHYVRSAAEMRALFPEDVYPGACDNTLLIAEMAKGFDLRLNAPEDYLIPKFPFDDPETDAKDELRRQVMIGANKHYADESGRIPVKVMERIDYELRVIDDMHFNDYFHIVGDMIQWGKSQGIAIGPGRGSAGGSVVAFCLSITMVDPIKYGLFFERFLNPGRISMPDIDVDIEPSRRQDMIQYVVRKYGAERVAQISTYGKVKAKSGILSAARVQGRTPADGARLSKLWPGVIAQAEADMKLVLSDEKPDGKFTKHWEKGVDLREAYQNSAEDKATIDLAIEMQGIRSQVGIHAAGVLITPSEATDYFPLRKDKKSDMPISAYNLGDAEALGGLKMDLLGLKNLSIIRMATVRIKEDLGKEINIDNIPLDDKKVYKMLAEGETDGVFQLESPGMRDLLMKVKPTEFEDISAVLALYRPGPMGSDLHLMYAEVKNGLRKVDVPHPDMLELMKDSLGVLCMTGDTLIKDASTGLSVRLDSIEDQVNAGTFKTVGIDAKGNPVVQNVSAFYRTGKKEVLSVTLKNGRNIRLSKDHPVMTPYGWKDAGELVLGDRLGMPAQELPIEASSGMTVDQARMAGYLIGDGHIGTRRSEVYTVSDGVLEDIQRICKESFPDVHPVVTERERVNMVSLNASAKGERVAGVRPGSAKGSSVYDTLSLNTWLREIGYTGTERSRDKFVPDAVFGGGSEVIKNFIAALWDCDGYADHKQTFLKTISKQLAEGTRELLDMIGIPSRIFVGKPYTSAKHGDTTPYTVMVTEPAFWDKIMPLMVTDKKLAVRSSATRTNSRGVAMSLLVEEMRSDIEANWVEVGYTPKSEKIGWKAASSFLNQKYPELGIYVDSKVKASQDDFIMLSEGVRGAVSLYSSEQLELSSNLHWDKIVSIESDGIEEMFDITVDEVHNFLANGIVSHNCYQEQLISLATHYAGFTVSEADNFRKATGKKDAVKLAQQEVAFKERSIARGFKPKVIGEIWDLIPPFAAYGFNKSHSVAYGMVTYQTAWLKANYPAQYIAACLDQMRDDQIPILVNVARDQGIEVYPPNINKSDFNTKTVDGNIWLSMSGIKGCGQSTLERIIEVRERGGEFKSLHEFLERTATSKLSIAAIKALIRAGAFDNLHGSRKLMFENVDEMKLAAKGAETPSEDDLFGSLEVDSKMDKFVLEGPDYTDNEKSKMEQEVLGFFTGRHPYLTVIEHLDEVERSGFLVPGSVPIDHKKVVDGANNLDIFGVVSSMTTTVNKGNGKTRTNFTLDNGKGVRLDGIHFGPVINNLEVGNFVCLNGSVGIDTLAMEKALNAISHDEDESEDGEVAEAVVGEPTIDAAPPLIFKVKTGRAIDIDKLLGGSYTHKVGADEQFQRERERRQSSTNKGRDGGYGGSKRGSGGGAGSGEGKPWQKKEGASPRAGSSAAEKPRYARETPAAAPRTASNRSRKLNLTFKSQSDFKSFHSMVEFKPGETEVNIRLDGKSYDYGKKITVPRSAEKLQMIADNFGCTIEHGGELLASPMA